MKKLLFSFVMMIALVIVAGSAMAQTGIAPYQGQTYTYHLGGVGVTSASTATIFYSNGTGVPSPSSVALAAGLNQTIDFDVAYSSSATSGTITVTITVDGAGGCSNHITLSIVPVAASTLSLVVATTSPAAICQTTDNVTNNTAASVGASNTFTDTITPTMSAGGTSYAYDFKLNDYLLGAATAISIVHSGTGTPEGGPNSDISVTGAVGVQTFTVTFATTTGVVAETITGTASNAVLTVGGTGAGTYAGTIPTNDISVSVKSVPAIGVFTY